MIKCVFSLQSFQWATGVRLWAVVGDPPKIAMARQWPESGSAQVDDDGPLLMTSSCMWGE